MRNILVVDDHPFFLHGFSQFLGGTNEFEVDTALSVDEAILKIDGLKMGESTVSVAISNPPARNTPMSDREQSFLPSLGGGKTETE